MSKREIRQKTLEIRRKEREILIDELALLQDSKPDKSITRRKHHSQPKFQTDPAYNELPSYLLTTRVAKTYHEGHTIILHQAWARRLHENISTMRQRAAIIYKIAEIFFRRNRGQLHWATKRKILSMTDALEVWTDTYLKHYPNERGELLEALRNYE